jgi:uncharacterized protein YndB with AHSA1/START domain
MIPDRIMHEVLLPVPLERAWRLVTEPQHLAAWYCPGGADIERPRPGGTLSFRRDAGRAFHGRIEHVAAPRAFVFQYALTPNVPPDPRNTTRVEITLHPEEAGTRLRLVESGFARIMGTDATRLAREVESREDWTEALEALRLYATTAKEDAP